MVLIGLFAVAMSIVLPKVASALSGEFASAAAALSEDEGTSGNCPTGWYLIAAGPVKKNGSNTDANGDGLVCQKHIPGGGNGNTGNNNNIKDNN